MILPVYPQLLPVHLNDGILYHRHAPDSWCMINCTDIWSYKLADDTCLECEKYDNVTDVGTSTGCAAVAQGHGITVDQLVNWNP